VPDLQSLLVKVENQAALYGTSWKVLQDSQNLLAEELKSIKSKNFAPKALCLKRKTLNEKAPPVSSFKVPDSGMKVPVLF